MEGCVTRAPVTHPSTTLAWRCLKAKIFALGEWYSYRGLRVVANSGVFSDLSGTGYHAEFSPEEMRLYKKEFQFQGRKL